MSQTTFLIQEENGILSPDAAQLIDCIRQRRWLDPECGLTWKRVSCDELRDIMHTMQFEQGEPYDKIVPFGSIEFVNTALQFETLDDQSHIRATNLPKDLWVYRYSRRDLWLVTKEQLINMVKSKTEIGAIKGDVFIKSADIPKGFAYNGPLEKAVSLLSNDNSKFLLVSTPFNSEIVSEWRAFIYRKNLMDVRPYALPHLDRGVIGTPNIALIQSAINAWSDIPTACTMDLAVLEDGRTAIVECHNFVSCGLYGYDLPNLPYMVIAGYKEELGAAMDDNVSTAG